MATNQNTLLLGVWRVYEKGSAVHWALELVENPFVHVKCMRRQARRATCEIYAHMLNAFREGAEGMPRPQSQCEAAGDDDESLPTWPVEQNS